MPTYDPASPQSILAHARLLLGKSLHDIHREATDYRAGKGGMGQTVERYHFGYEPNSTPEADFPEAGVELKCTPLKQNSDGSMVSKERMVLNIIDYMAESEATFPTSSFWKKNHLLLLMFYLHENGVDIVKLIFKIVRLWSFPDVDLKIIRDDWEKIHRKIATGHAHELSEGDTLYLGACPKGARGGANKRRQPHSDILADQRAYSLKSKYINTIILDSLAHPEMVSGISWSEHQRKRVLSETERANYAVSSLSEYQRGETFEQLIERRFSPYYGKNIRQIESLLGVSITSKAKAISNAVIHAVLGVKTPKVREFENANIQQKSIRLEHNGRLREAMVFSQIKYDELADEECWEDSLWYATLTQRFLFVVFRKDAGGDDMEAVLQKVFFWTMPTEDLCEARKFWLDTRDKVRQGSFDNFMSASDGNICHVRPKAKNSLDLMPTRFGPQKKNGYWLNREYVLRIVNEHL